MLWTSRNCSPGEVRPESRRLSKIHKGQFLKKQCGGALVGLSGNVCLVDEVIWEP